MKYLIIFLKAVITFVSIFALVDMIVTNQTKFICLPLGILCSALYDIIQGYKIEYSPPYHTNPPSGMYESWGGTAYQDKHHHIYTSTLDVEKKAIKQIKRGLKITINNHN